jgi:hypothetical protein
MSNNSIAREFSRTLGELAATDIWKLETKLLSIRMASTEYRRRLVAYGVPQKLRQFLSLVEPNSDVSISLRSSIEELESLNPEFRTRDDEDAGDT